MSRPRSYWMIAGLLVLLGITLFHMMFALLQDIPTHKELVVPFTQQLWAVSLGSVFSLDIGFILLFIFINDIYEERKHA